VLRDLLLRDSGGCGAFRGIGLTLADHLLRVAEAAA
jgi:hypothetical protein